MSLRKGRRPLRTPPGWKLKFFLTGLIGLAVAAPRPILAAAADPSPRHPQPLSELVRAWTRKTAPLPPKPAGGATTISRMDALRALAGGAETARCATSLMVSLRHNAKDLNQPTRMLMDRALALSLPSPSGSQASPGGEFLVHYSTNALSSDRVDPTDDDLDGIPDGVERIAAEFTDVLADFIHVLEWAPAPAAAPLAPGARPVVDVYLVGLAGGRGAAVTVDGFAMPSPFVAPRDAEASDAVIFLDTRLASPGVASRPAVAHQVAHLAQLRESSREAPWWYESSALWLETRLNANLADRAIEHGSRASRRAAGPAEDSIVAGLEAFLWPHYLAQSTGSGDFLVRRLWEEMAAVPGDNTLEAMDRVMSRDLGTSLAQEVRIFNIWNLFLGQSDDGRHYSFGSLLPTPQGDGTYENFPVQGGSPGGAVSPLGSSLIRVLADGRPGGLRLRFDGAPEATWDVSLLVYDASGARGVRFVPLRTDIDGRTDIAFPWRGLGAVDLLIQNLTIPDGQAQEYSFAVEYEPTIPFDLLGFGAFEEDRGARLSWSTDREEGLAGWNVYRGASPLGPFARLNRYLVPGAGTTDRPMNYVFVDSSADPGRKYYYYVEGVTFEGFSENSHAAGVRLGDRSPRASRR